MSATIDSKFSRIDDYVTRSPILRARNRGENDIRLEGGISIVVRGSVFDEVDE
jgi:hypothetical protein